MMASQTRKIGKVLIRAARDQLFKAYVPYSNFRVACALMTDDGNIVAGVNVENGSYGLTVCAERCAIFVGVSAGHKSFQAAAVVGDVNGATPCGACRQVLAEFMHQDAPLFYVGEKGEMRCVSIGKLLPLRFSKPSDYQITR